MNFVLGVLSICLTTLISAMIAEKYKEEYEFYSDFSKFNQQLLNEVSFSKKSILTLIKSNKNNTFAKLCEKFLNNENYEIKINKKGKEDSEFIKEYLKNIGNTDKETQIVFLKKIDKEIIEKKNKAEDVYKNNKKLYLKIGFFAGLIIFIICL